MDRVQPEKGFLNLFIWDRWKHSSGHGEIRVDDINKPVVDLVERAWSYGYTLVNFAGRYKAWPINDGTSLSYTYQFCLVFLNRDGDLRIWICGPANKPDTPMVFKKFEDARRLRRRFPFGGGGTTWPPFLYAWINYMECYWHYHEPIYYRK
jgi:hypothetical protein